MHSDSFMSNYVQFGPSLPGIGTDTKRLSSELRKFSFLPFLLNCIGMFGYFVHKVVLYPYQYLVKMAQTARNYS
jgi:hypothetical protein